MDGRGTGDVAHGFVVRGRAEAGNEVNGLDFDFRMLDGFGPDRYAQGVRRLRPRLDEIHPEGRLSAPQTYFFPDPIVGDLGRFSARALAEAGDAVDLVSWHLYATQSDRCAGEGA
ncbi:MAG TPA: hypothetical protein RMH99_08550 [Sandaracinaceae bacterium LLY-WYZ-13_1]|nr:hypothetical protein [Sandaracinaceae bacterium LLY-WYZ-13_1]